MRLPWRKDQTAQRSFIEQYGAILKAFAQSGVVGGVNPALGYTTTYGERKAEPIGDHFAGLVQGALKSNGIVWAVERVRVSLFAEARFQFQAFNKGRPGDLYGDTSLAILERPFPGGTTGDLLSRMLLDADFAGNAFVALIDDQLVRLRPDWVEILLGDRLGPYGPGASDVVVGQEKVGYYYYEGGKGLGKVPAFFGVDEIAHFAPNADPECTYRGMSWLTPVIQEIQADDMATKHKVKFFENAATPNLSVSIPVGPVPMTPAQFKEFVDAMDEQHKGVENAYKTLYTANGADVRVIGANMQQLDFRATQGAGETRIASAGRVPPVLAGFSEGLAGSSLNQGNYNAAKRSFAQGEMRSLWRNAAGSLEVLVPPPSGSRLWYDVRDIAFLAEDEKDAADIQFTNTQAIKALIEAGMTADSAIAAVNAGDLSLLSHSGLVSVQLQEPGSGQPTEPKATP